MSPRLRRLLVPALSTAVMLAILLGLGVWQVHRLAWKRGILAAIAAAEAAPPVPLPATGTPPDFTKVAASGVLRPDLAVSFGAAVHDLRGVPMLGADLVVPLIRPGAPPLLVDLGWVPQPAPAPLTLPGGVVSVAGFVHPPVKPGLFSASDDPAGRRYYTLDPAKIGRQIGLGRVAPFTLIAMGDTPALGYPRPADHLPRPPNNHLQYAATWFGLAGALAVIFAAYARKVLTA
ncbi:MAG: SURF1 family protein [Rhodospirillales bacterium]|nr:SURF1 family protein [Rhodospirillales bacterium]